MAWIESPRRSSITPANLVAVTKVYQDLRAPDDGKDNKQKRAACWSGATENLGESVIDFIQKLAAEEEIDSLEEHPLSTDTEDVDLVNYLSAHFGGLQALSVMLGSELSTAGRKTSDEEYESNCSRLLIHKNPRTNQSSDAITID